jgi:hypothetical protein
MRAFGHAKTHDFDRVAAEWFARPQQLAESTVRAD